MNKHLKRFLAFVLILCTLLLHCVVPTFAEGTRGIIAPTDPEIDETLYDVSSSSVYTDFYNLFNPIIYPPRYDRKEGKTAEASRYIEIVAFYSDAKWFDWGDLVAKSGNDYIYIYDSCGEMPLSGRLFYGDGQSVNLIAVSKEKFFTKFRLDEPIRVFENGTSAKLPIKSIRLLFSGPVLRSYGFMDNSYISFDYTNRTDFKIAEISMENCVSKLQIHIDYTYWRSSNISEKGDGWHYQVDSIYFSIPKSIQDRLVDVDLSYQQATTKPIVVTKTGEVVDGINVSEWFRDSALDPENFVTNKTGKPCFIVGYRTNPNGPDTYKYAYNCLPYLSPAMVDLRSIYWAFDVEDPSIVSSGSLTSGELSDPKSSVSGERLLEWMLNYPMEGAETVYTALSSEGIVTQQVNGILFSDVQDRVTVNAASLIGKQLPSFGDTHNFWQNLCEVGLPYAWAYLTGAARKDKDGNDIPIDSLQSVIHELKKVSDIETKSDDYHFAKSEEDKLKAALSASKNNNERLFLVNFNCSDYYSYSFDGGFSGYHVPTGYLAIQDVYLDLEVITLYFQNKAGVVYPLDVESNHIVGVAPITHAPEDEQLNEAAMEAIAQATDSWLDDLISFLKKVLMILLVLFGSSIILRTVLYFIMLSKQKKSQEGSPAEAKRRRGSGRKQKPFSRIVRKGRGRRSDRQYNRRWRR